MPPILLDSSTDHDFQVYNDFLLHVHPDRMRKLLARFVLFQSIQGLPGDIVEAGVLKGAGLLTWAKFAFCTGTPRTIVGFDTFAGFPDTISAAERAAVAHLNAAAPVDTSALEEAVRGMGLGCLLFQGDIAETVHSYTGRIALLNLDLDHRDATRIALRGLLPKVVPGGVVILDEYGVHGFTESEAVDEFAPDLKRISWAKSPTAFFYKGGR